MSTTESSSSNSLRGFVLGPGGAATTAGICEIVVFHPADTAAKRLMSFEHRIILPSVAQTAQNIQSVLFRGASPGFLNHAAHMYPGAQYAVVYKASQRFIKFAGQPYAKDFLEHQHSKWAGERQQRLPARDKMMLEAVAGCLVGVLECILLPVDRMKVISQTNPAALARRSMVRVCFEEGVIAMYAGLATTMSRNILGSFLLFGGTALVKEFVFHLEDYRRATFLQNMMSSTIGACLGVVATSPLDVLKTRIQNKNFALGNHTGVQILKHVLVKEGPQALWKGITPKVITTAPRLVFSYTLSQYLTQVFRNFV